ncbi:MAG: leucyl aminopeptidase, partial [Gammaproteobacteria bacterium]|nr:leucyl aminopeptidase [Gammaproteobacteria bacterium]
MEITVKSGTPEKQRTACIVVGVFDSRKLSAAAGEVDKASEGYISNIVRRGDMDGEKGQSLLLHNVPGILADRVLLIGLGKERDMSDRVFRQLNASAAQILDRSGASEAVSYLTDLNVKNRTSAWKCYAAALDSESALYKFNTHKSNPETSRKPLKKIVFNVPSRRDLLDGEAAVLKARAVVGGMNLTRNLGNLAPNVCTPGYLARQAQQLKRQYKKLKIEVLEEADMKRLGMNALLSVSEGSKQPAKLICMEYNGAPKTEKPVVLVGKGVTFDSGGISIKPSANMDEMKFDMCGAASVFGVIRACADMQLDCNVIGIVPTVENMPSGTATRPGDIVTSMSGTTIEILNTDAEGRLILCDALTYAAKYDPDTVIDIATLTGACI